MLDLGKVRGTVDVTCNGQSAGDALLVRRTNLKLGRSYMRVRIISEILVCNTLAPYLEASTPTPYVFAGQTRSGLFGPVQIRFS